MKVGVEDSSRIEGLWGGAYRELIQCDLIFEDVSTDCVYITISVTENKKR